MLEHWKHIFIRYQLLWIWHYCRTHEDLQCNENFNCTEVMTLSTLKVYWWVLFCRKSYVITGHCAEHVTFVVRLKHLHCSASDAVSVFDTLFGEGFNIPQMCSHMCKTVSIKRWEERVRKKKGVEKMRSIIVFIMECMWLVHIITLWSFWQNVHLHTWLHAHTD